MEVNPSNEDERPGLTRSQPDAARKTGVLSSRLGRVLLAVCLLQLALLIKLGWGSRPQEKPLLPALSHATPQDNAAEPIFRANPGPWGELEYVRINLQPPDDFLPVEDGSFARAHWFFEGHTRAQLTRA